MPSGTRAQGGRRVVAAILVLAGSPFYVVCGFSHMCTCGHLRHTPLPWLAVAVDIAWISCFAAAAVFSIRSNLWRRRTLAVLLALLLAPNLLGAGAFDVFMLLVPVVVAIAVTGLLVPVGGRAADAKEKQAAQDDSDIAAK